MTRRERMERRAERRREWAAGREARSEAAFNRARVVADGIPLGQPILVGHHSEGRHRRDIERIDSGMRQGCESAKMAELHRSKADGIEHALERSIFSDDPDAPERIAERVAELEARRDAMKAANKAYKAGGFDAVRVAVGDAMALEGARILQVQPYYKVPFPPYALTNIGGNIRRLKARVAEIARQAERQAAAEAAPGGVLVGRSTEHDYVSVRFADYPGREKVNALKAAGFHWSGGAWHGMGKDLPYGIEVA